MPVKKSELYSSIWESADELRGGMDASQYKDYVLSLLFVKYVSDKYAGREDALLDVPEGASFADMVALAGNKDIGERINTILGRLAEANDLSGVIDAADFDDPSKLGSGKERVDRLSKLVAIFDRPELDFRSNRAEGDDILGDAYEYLMRHFAAQSGKSKGQFYTPAEVSRIMARVIGIGAATSPGQTIYDPTCGSGSLLLKAHDEAPVNVTIYGQEMDNATRALAKMNMILHDSPSADIWQGNTLASPHFKSNGALKTFDFVVANPPFSTKSWSSGFDPANDEFKRFRFGVPPAKNGDYAFLSHVIASLEREGKGAIILPHGVLFRGHAEADIRRRIVKHGLIKGIIGLPANLFYGVGISACIIVLDKQDADRREGVFMIDASRGFIKDGNKNRLRAQDIHKVVDAFTRRAEVDRFSRMVPIAEIEQNDFNLNLPGYIDSTEAEDRQDIDAHLHGGIPVRDVEALEDYWHVFPGVRSALFTDADRPDYAQLNVDKDEIRATIFEHTEFDTFQRSVKDLFERWRKANAPALESIAVGDRPKELIGELSEDLLDTFRDAALIDPYDVYQHLMDFWAEVMQDDVYMIVSDGWEEAAKPRAIAEQKGKHNKERGDFAIGKQEYRTELVPRAVMESRYFAREREAIELLEGEREAIMRRLEELADEHGAADGILEDATNEKGKLTKGSVNARLAEIKHGEIDEERELLDECAALLRKEAAAKKKVKDAEGSLEVRLAKKYDELIEAEVKDLVVNHKWLATLAGAVEGDLERVSQGLASRVRELAERYEAPVPELTQKVAALAARVDEHLQTMGAA